MRRPESPDEIRARLRALDRIVQSVGADAGDAFDADDLRRIHEVLLAARRAARAR